jgi:hypothetical protein
MSVISAVLDIRQAGATLHQCTEERAASAEGHTLHLALPLGSAWVKTCHNKRSLLDSLQLRGLKAARKTQATSNSLLLLKQSKVQLGTRQEQACEMAGIAAYAMNAEVTAGSLAG